MNMKLIQFRPIVVLITIIILCLGDQTAAKENPYLLQANTHSVLSEVHEDLVNLENSKALVKLGKLLNSKKLKKYDTAIIYQTMGYAENGLGNFTVAAKHFVKALSFDVLSKEVAHELYYSTAQLLIHIEKPRQGIKYLSKWFANEPQAKAEAHILAATAYYYLEDYKQLIVHVEKALPLSKKPPLNWYELLLAGYYETKEYFNAIEILEKIINTYPGKTEYWLQLAGIYQRQKQEKKALAIYELAYTKELLKKEGVVQLVKNYRYLEMPYKAATILEKEMAIGDIDANKEMLDMLVDSWILAQENEKAKSVFNEIIKKFNDDTARLRLGQLYLEAEEWKKAILVLNVNLETVDKILLSKINLLLGIAQYHSDNFTKATRAFTHALSDKSTKDQATWWLEHLQKKTEIAQQS